MDEHLMMNRRKLLKVIAAGSCGAAMHGVISPLDQFSAYAAPGTPQDGKVLVLVNMEGEVSYNIANPLNSVYMDKNPTVSYTASTGIPISSEQVLHPSLTGFKQLYDEGTLALINMVGFTAPANRSHDESTDIWFSGLRSFTSGMKSGWAARMANQTPTNQFASISLGGTNLLVSGGVNPPRAFGNLQNFGENNFWGGDSGTRWLHITRDLVRSDSPGIAQPDFNLVKGSIDSLEGSLETIKKETSITLPVTFPTTAFGNRCRDAARLIAARSLNVKLIYLSLGGFDTHANERSALTGRLNEMNGGLTALASCIKALSRWNDVTILTMSEFSRTFENGSQGTDHGHSGAMFVMGGSVLGGIKTPAPTAAETSRDGFFRDFHVDFREVFRSAVGYMGYSPDAIFPEPIRYRGLRLFR
jgi:uncharacterized protein (DUF1501 family)